jgi:hypothetical protein
MVVLSKIDFISQPVQYKTRLQLFVVTWMLLLFAAIAGCFWYKDWQYNLPTAKPAGYKSVGIGSYISLHKGNNGPLAKPVLLHFFNPDCPCSRFNIAHVRNLMHQYGTQVDFVIVLQTSAHYQPEEIRRRFDLDSVDVICRPGLAAQCGVYSTPQAVILDTTSRLFYRGNYNQSRYCVNRQTNYAQQALDDLLQHQTPLFFKAKATTAYGCGLPRCSKP